MTRAQSESGFSLIELLVAMGVLMVVSAIVTTAIQQMTQSQTTIWNRTEMHSGIRGATELLQQEVGQAGRISTPTAITLNAAVNPIGGTVCDAGVPLTNAITVAVNSVDGVFAAPGAYEILTTMDGERQEAVKIAAVDKVNRTITACFQNVHDINTVLQPMGGFANGIVPDTVANGSTTTVLKLFGDIVGDGKMVYVEYTCDYANKNLYRNVIAFDSTNPKPAVTNEQILLSNIIANPGGTPCFKYQTASATAQNATFTFVTDVAVTLTVQTQQLDPITRTYQTETKALLNVSPRNVFNAWEQASMGYTDRIQSTPVTVTNLLP